MNPYLGDVLLILWAAPAIAAMIEFGLIRGEDGRRGGFRHAVLGRLLMAHMAALAALAVLGLLRLIIDDTVLFRTVRVTAFVALIGVTWWWWWTIHHSRLRSIAEMGRERGHHDEVHP